MNSPWQISLTVPKDQVEDVEQALLGLAPADEPPGLSSFEIDGTPDWQVDAYFADQPDAQATQDALAAWTFDANPTEQVDWVAQSLTHHQQVTGGRFHIYGSHHDRPPSGGLAIKVDAGMAFGTGQHETTLGCLRAIDALVKKRRITGGLDLGCGTGILAIALARASTHPVMASDIDPVAIDVARDNARDNGVQRQISFVTAPGMRHRALAQNAPYDLIVANILARPLCAMATDISRSLTPGGDLVLSGLLTTQEQMVLRTYRNRGLVLRRRFIIGEWSTLHLKRIA